VTDNTPRCPICNESLLIRLARGRKSGKAFVMLVCAIDGRHFRGFINHQSYVKQVIENIEATNKTEK
jgi:hypothetical protein